MDEATWLTSADPAAMLRHLTHEHLHASGVRSEWRPRLQPLISPRKLRLFACGCCRLVWDKLTDERSRRAVEVAERFADGEAAEREVTAAQNAVDQVFRDLGNYSQNWSTERQSWWLARSTLLGAEQAAREAVRCELPGQPATQAALLRSMVNPWRPVPPLRAYDLGRGCPWLTDTVKALAEACYSERNGDGTLDGVRLAVLADACEDASCTDAAILDSLRQREERVRCTNLECECGGHGHIIRAVRRYRGFAPLDAILGKE